MTLDDMFHPRSIAVVGATEGPANINTIMFLDSLLEFGYQGQIYPVNPRLSQVSGLKAYPNIRDIPGPVDYVISLIPAEATPQLIADCVAKGVKTAQFFTAGFVETGEKNRARLQDELVRIARAGGVRLLGPNCVGIYCPASRMSYCADFPKESGRVGFVAQSGGYTYLAVRMGAGRGVYYSKVISYGNASDVNEADLLEYLAADPETDIITAYIEGTTDGRRLLKVLTDAAARKPVIVIKKGRTEAGRKGTMSHTGALAGDDKVWDSALRQAGVIRVEDVDEMVDLLVAFLFMPVPRGRRTVVIGAGGGVSVRAAEECESAGLMLPTVPDDLRSEINRYFSLAGSMLRNPVDILAEPLGDGAWAPVLKALDGWQEADVILWQMSPDMEPIRTAEFCRIVLDIRRTMVRSFNSVQKPKALAIHTLETHSGLEEMVALREACRHEKIAFYPSVYRAALAISRYISYHHRGRALPAANLQGARW
ncbi:MAG: CoA-binding protein [Dehalococcoidia bacterium]|nr:CoA-binding protein [Dehalococcoidia bacterium]